MSVKTWYTHEQESFKAVRRTSRSQGVDSLPFLPQWDKVTTFMLPDGTKLLVAPVIRYAPVRYNMQLGFVRRLAVHLKADNSVKEARILEFVGERSYIATHQDSLSLYYITGKPFQGFVLNMNITHQFLQSNASLRTESVSCDPDGGMVIGVQYTETLESGVCIESTTYFYGFDSLGEPITCTDDVEKLCPITVTTNPSSGGIGNTGGNPSGNPVGFPSSSGISTGSNPWNGWGLGSNYGGGIGTTPIYVNDPNPIYPPIDPGTNVGDPRDNWGIIVPPINDPIEDARVLNQLNAITANYGIPQSNGTFQYAPTEAQKLELARTLDRLIKESPVYNRMYAIYQQKNIKITWRIKSDIGSRGKAQIFVNPDGSRQNVISFNGTNSLRSNSTVAEEMIHILQLDKKGEVTGSFTVPENQRVCIEYEAKAVIKMTVANGASRKFDTDSFFDVREKYKYSDPDRYNQIVRFEKAFGDFLKKYKNSLLPKSRNDMDWTLFMNLLNDFNQYGPSEYNFPANYDANGWEWAIMFELFNY
jgi:hypothetical protein